MDRRRFLSLSTGCLPALAGCQARDAAPGATGSPTPDATPDDPARPIAVGLETSRYLVLSDEQTPEERAIDPGDVVPGADLPDVLRTALEAARDGGYEADEVSPDLLSAIDGFRHNGVGYRFEPYVSLDGTPYAFDPTVPVFVARLAFDVDDPNQARTIEYDDLDRFDESVADLVGTIGAFGTESPRDEYRVSVVPDPVERFLERYDYVRDPEDVGRIVAERVDPGPPYSIEIRALTTEDLWGRPVLDGDALPADLREFLATAAASDRRAPAHPPLRHEHRTDAVPSAYFDRLRAEDGRDPYVELDGTKYAFRVLAVDRAAVPVELSVAPGSPDGQRSFSVTVEPSSSGARPAFEGPVELSAAGALPSVLWVQTASGRHLLPSDAYATVSWEPAEPPATVDRRVRNVARRSVAPGDALSATYRVPDAMPAGTYRAWGRFDASWTESGAGRPSPRVPYPFQVALTVRDA